MDNRTSLHIEVVLEYVFICSYMPMHTTGYDRLDIVMIVVIIRQIIS